MEQQFDHKYKKSYSDGSGHWYPTFSIRKGKIHIPFRLGDYEEYISMYDEIHYCPWCGSKIGDSGEDTIANDPDLDLKLDEKRKVPKGSWLTRLLQRK